jgi:DinB superfamily
MSASVANTIDNLRTLLHELPRELQAISESAAAPRRPDGGWSRKEILGHLIDSATVNHQRFVRAQLETGVSLLYEQNQWVDLQRYRDRPWDELVALWTAVNRHLLRAIESIADEKLQNLCGQGSEGGDGDVEPWTLAYRIPDYLQHMRHHIEQIRRFE